MWQTLKIFADVMNMFVKMKVFLLLPLLTLSLADSEIPEHGSHHPVREPHEVNGEHNPEFDHEAVIGSRTGHNEFESLPPEEAKARLAVLVDRMDTNKDGRIEEDELSEWVYNSFISLDAEEARDYFHDQDKDEDGSVSFKEYLENYYGFDPDETEDWEKDDNPEMEAYGKLIKDDSIRFHKADQDGNGVLDEQEYSAFYHPWDHPEMHDFEIDKALADSDDNGDGFIDLKEYLGGDVGDTENELIEVENFRAFDENGDNLLDRQEIKEWVIPNHQETAKEEAIHLIQETDANKDGYLSKDEILDKHEAWVGSAATDYGAQINDENFHDPGEL